MQLCFSSLNIGALLHEPNIFFLATRWGIFKVNKQKSQVKVSWDRALNQSMKKGGKFKLGKQNLNPRISNPNQSLVGCPFKALTRTGTRPETRPEQGGARRGGHFIGRVGSGRVCKSSKIRVFFGSIPEKVVETRTFHCARKSINNSII